MVRFQPPIYLSHLSSIIIQLTFYFTGVGAIHLNKPAVLTFMANMFAACANLSVTTVSINGHKNFTTWEWNLTFNYVEPNKDAASEKKFAGETADGKLIRMVGASISWWNDEGKIIRKS